MADSTVEFIIKIRDELSPALDNASKATKNLEGKLDGAKEHAESFGKVLKEAAVFAAELFAVEKILDWGKDAVMETVKLNMAWAGLGQTIEDSHNKNALTLAQYKEQTEELRKHSDFTKIQIVGTEARLAGVKGLTSEMQKQAAQVALDLASRKQLYNPEDKQNPVESANALAKALTNPEKATRLLTEANILLTKAQKKNIEQAVESGQKLRIQKAILDSVGASVEGMAEKLRAADPFAAIKQGMEELSEKAGPLLLELFDKIEPAIEYALNTARDFFTWVDQHRADFKEAWESFTPTFAGSKEALDLLKGDLVDLAAWMRGDGSDAVFDFSMALGKGLIAAEGTAKDLVKLLAGTAIYLEAIGQDLSFHPGQAKKTGKEGAHLIYNALFERDPKEDAAYARLDELRKEHEKKKHELGGYGAPVLGGNTPYVFGSENKKGGEADTPGAPGAGVASPAGFHPTQIIVNIDKLGETHITTSTLDGKTEDDIADIVVKSLLAGVNQFTGLIQRI